MSYVRYILPKALLDLQGVNYRAHDIPDDPTLVIALVDWNGDTLAESEFDAQPGVIRLPEDWEPMPVEASELLASLNDPEKVAEEAAGALPVLEGAPIVPETVASALRKLAWVGARMTK